MLDQFPSVPSEVRCAVVRESLECGAKDGKKPQSVPSTHVTSVPALYISVSSAAEDALAAFCMTSVELLSAIWSAPASLSALPCI